MKNKTILPAALLAAALAGCGATPIEYHSQTEIPRGPGMFSGDEGGLAFRLSGFSGKSAETKSATPTAPAAAPNRPLSAEELQEFREFQEFKEWKRRNEKQQIR